MNENDELFTPLQEINNMFATHLPCLPPTDVNKSGLQLDEMKSAKNDNDNNSNKEKEKQTVEQVKELLLQQQQHKKAHDVQQHLFAGADKQVQQKEIQGKQENVVNGEVDGANVHECVTDSVTHSESTLENAAQNSNNNTAEQKVAEESNKHCNANDTKEGSQIMNADEKYQNSNQNNLKVLQQKRKQQQQQQQDQQYQKEEEAKIVEAIIHNEVVCTQQVIKPIGLQDEKVVLESVDHANSQKRIQQTKEKDVIDAEDGTAAAAAADNTNDEDDDKEMQETFAQYVKSELANYQLEQSEITKKLNQIELQLAGGVVENEILTTAQKKKDILEEMLRIHNELRQLRTKPYTLNSFLQATQLDLHKARVNLGEWNDENTEQYADESERALTPTQLMARGLEQLQQQNITSTIHYLRLAAIHHKHEQSTLLLYAVCSRCGLPGGATLLFRRALDKLNPSAACNHKLGELYDQGARYFMPVFPAAIYFYERAAKLGSVNAMLALAQLWCRGATASSLLTEKRAQALIDTRKYHGWLDKAVDRGSGSAYFVKGCLHLHGQHGVKRSYELAKDYFDAARKALPQIMRRTQVVLPMLEQLRIEEEKQQQQKQKQTQTLQDKQQQNSAMANGSLQELNKSNSVHNSNANLRKVENGKGVHVPKTVANGLRSTKTNAASHAGSSTVTVAGKNKLANNVANSNKNSDYDDDYNDNDDDDEEGDMAVNRAPNAVMTASKARLNALTNRGSEVATRQTSRTAPVHRARKGGMLSSSSAARKAMWEKVCVTSLTLYGLYAVLFPIRVIMLPYFYSFISGFVESIPWLANSNADLSAFYQKGTKKI